MNLASTFMVHVSPHWIDRGVDDLSFWPFSVRNSALLQNQVPNQQSDLTHIGLLMKTKSDHQD